MSFLYNVQIRITQIKLAVGILTTLAVFAFVTAVGYISAEIARQSTVDEAQPADVILVLGAAEYHGKPSPVLRARLDHALTLYKKGLAPRILTTGGAGGDPVYTEGTVGRSYLVSQGVPSEAIMVEPEGESTVYSTAAADVTRRANVQVRNQAFNGVLQSVCAQYIHCRYDGGAAYGINFLASDVGTLDYFHPNTNG